MCQLKLFHTIVRLNSKTMKIVWLIVQLLTLFPFFFLATNLALGKPARQSSLDDIYPGAAANVVDGNYATWTNDRSQYLCSHTDNTERSWWAVDLEVTYQITNILVYNREDGKKWYCLFTLSSSKNRPFATSSVG